MVLFVIASSLILMVPVKSKSKLKAKKLTRSTIRVNVTCWKTVYNVRGLFICYSVYMQNIFQMIPVHVIIHTSRPL